MNRTRRLSGQLALCLCGTLAGLLTGCLEPQPRVVYVAPQRPVPEVVYVASPELAPAAVDLAPPQLNASVSVELPAVEIRVESDFYQPLTEYGRWEVVGSYGRCWFPGRVQADWRPYSDGYWQRTDAGWYWASTEPWGWATYHYGRWDLSAGLGWYWVPQTQWAPAWVSWHRGGGYVGWAPLHPSARFEAGGSIQVNRQAIPSRAYVFVHEDRFLQPVRPSAVVINNTTIINNTVNITNVKIVNHTVINEGPAAGVIEKATGQRVQVVAAPEFRRRQEAAVMPPLHTTQPVTVRNTRAEVPAAVRPPRNTPAVGREAPLFEKRAFPVPKPAVPEPIQRQGKDPVPAREAPAVERRTAPPPHPATPAAIERGTQRVQQKPVLPPVTDPRPSTPSAMKPLPPSNTHHPVAPRPANVQNTDRRLEKESRPAKPPAKVPAPARNVKPVLTDKKQPNAADKNHE